MPVSELFEAEVQILELLDYKPILSKGYMCMLHVHTVAEECTIKDIMVAYEKNDKGEITEKIKPQFTKSKAKITCRIQMRLPIPLEKFDVLDSMGRFTLRDEGKTIALGKIIKYKPTKIQEATNAAAKEGVKTDGPSSEFAHGIIEKGEESKKAPDLVFDLESGEMKTKDELRAAEAIDEEDEDESGSDDEGG
jgi:hypothetical protein